MDPHLLRTFVAVIDHRSFSAAAQALGYTQSAVSQHIAALEADLGTRLVERRPVGPTESGGRLMEHARPLLLRLDAARADIVGLHGIRPGRLAVACAPGTVTPAFAGALARVRRAEPGLSTTVQVLGRDAVLRAVMTGEADLGLVDGIAAPSDPLPLPDTGPMTTLALAEGPLAVLLPLGHPLAGRRALRLPDLADAHWLDAPDTAVPLSQLRAAAQTDGFRRGASYAGTDLAGLGTLVASGHGLAVLASATAAALPDTIAVPVSAPRLVHRTEALHPRRTTTATRSLLAALGG
ncbi:LysR family transcriptional regulator [Streptomyces gilvosporeus]|uniref:LysR family transcriptional regulator n=1 Tax=Streptomyces gilvosporeus TaxID=553510 RepID=A0A1V0TLP3_9ACTN|nr:LysR family transcriptional regulator [Streptomyces gilvosporeus]ARF53847.1 LysR family transcriptional regulator [Streptomyces gilvosporeus]